MPFGVDASRVKAKCGITVSDFDTAISNLIAEQVPVLEYAIEPTFIAAIDDDGGLEATLNLAATEIVCGEFLAERMRSPGGLDTLRIGDLTLEPMKMESSKALDLIAVGWARLKPFLKKDVGVLASTIGALGSKGGAA